MKQMANEDTVGNQSILVQPWPSIDDLYPLEEAEVSGSVILSKLESIWFIEVVNLNLQIKKHRKTNKLKI